jgi:hypothetical protein
LHSYIKKTIGLALLAALAACTSGQNASEPPFQAANLTADTVRLAVGVATFRAPATFKGINTVATFRQPSGLSATLVNTPALTGPFTNTPGTACAANTNTGTSGPTNSGSLDGSTGSILGSPQVPPGILANCTTFGTAGGVFAYGFAPENASTSGADVFTLYAQPFYAKAANVQYNGSTTTRTYKCGPPACLLPLLAAGSVPAPSGFTGFTQGFITFGLTPVLGNYSLSVGIQNSTGQTTTVTSNTAVMASLVGLPPYPTPTLVSKDGTGGIVVNVVPPVGVTETLVDLIDASTGSTLTIVVQGAAPANVTFPDTFVNSVGVTTQSINSGDTWRVTAIGVNYPAFEAGPPGNTSSAPTITGANGQADITFSGELSQIY